MINNPFNDVASERVERVGGPMSINYVYIRKVAHSKLVDNHNNVSVPG